MIASLVRQNYLENLGKSWNVFPQTLAHFSGCENTLSTVGWFCYTSFPLYIHIVWNRKRIIKVIVESKSADSGDEQSFRFEECQRFFLAASIQRRTTRYFPVQLHTSLRHQCPTHFLSLSGLKIIPFLSSQKFSTHHTECSGLLVTNGRLFLKTRNEIIIHNFDFSLSFSYRIKFTLNEMDGQNEVLLIFHMKNHYLTEVELVRLSMFNFPSTFIRLNFRCLCFLAIALSKWH